jgi:hypothetical protein
VNVIRIAIQKNPAKTNSLVSGLSVLTCMKNQITNVILMAAIASATMTLN